MPVTHISDRTTLCDPRYLITEHTPPEQARRYAIAALPDELASLIADRPPDHTYMAGQIKLWIITPDPPT
jgi:hypothetical protein